MDKSNLNQITRYFLEAKLSKEQEKELLLWIKSDEGNRILFLKEQELLNSQVLNKEDKNLNLPWNAINNRIQIQGKRIQINSLFFKVASIAAAFILGIILTAIVTSDLFSGFGQSAQRQYITTPYGARTNTTLPDGSIVWLNSGSTLSFPSKFNRTRPVKLTGEAFFEVEKDDKPFIVSTIYGDVEVKGTSFNVRAFNDDNLQTTLVSGSVLVKEKVANKEVVLRPGQQVNLVRNQFVVKNVETEFFTSWKNGKLIFRDAFLPEVAKRLERWYNVKIELENDKRLEKISYSGTLEMETFAEVLDLLEYTAPITYEYNEKTRTIHITFKQN